MKEEEPLGYGDLYLALGLVEGQGARGEVQEDTNGLRAREHER